MVAGVALGAMLLASAPAIVLHFALPTAWMAVVSLPLFSGVAPWVDYASAVGQMTEYVMSATQWAHAGTSLLIWMVLPLLIGACANHAIRSHRTQDTTNQDRGVTGTEKSSARLLLVEAVA